MPRCRKPVWTRTFTDWNQVPLLLSVQETCQLLHWSDVTVRRRINDGTLKAIKEGNKFLVSKQSIIDLIN